MTTPTTDPVPSILPQNLLFNAEFLDRFINGTALACSDRFNVQRRSIAGVVAALDLKEADVEARRSQAASAIAEDVAAVEALSESTAEQFAAKLNNLTLPDREVLQSPVGGSLIGLAEGGSVQNAIDTLAAYGSGRKVVQVDSIPYLGDFQAAVADLTENTVLAVGVRTYDFLGVHLLDILPESGGGVWRGNLVRNVTLLGVRPGEIAEDESHMISGSGSIIRGMFVNFADGFEAFNIGFDAGADAVAANGGVYFDGLVAGTHKLVGVWSDWATYIKGVRVADVKILMAPATSDVATHKHGCLMERIDGGSHGNIEICGGALGYINKSRNIAATGIVRLYGQTGACAVLKSEQYSAFQDYHGARFVIGKPEPYRITASMQFQAATDGVPWGNSTIAVSAVNYKGMSPFATSSQPMDSLTIIDYFADGVFGALALEMPSTARFWKLGPHTLRNVEAGVKTNPGCTQILIGDGTVNGCRQNAYILGGDVDHSMLSVANTSLSAPGTFPAVLNAGTAGINPERIIDAGNNTGGLVSGVFNATGFVASQNGWGDASGGTYGADLYGRRMRMRGRLGGGSGPVVFNINANFKPKRDMQVVVVGHNGTTYVPALLFISASTGDATLQDHTVFNGGGPAGVCFDGLEWGY